MIKEINKSNHIEWAKHPELLMEIDSLRESEMAFPRIADVFKNKYNLDVHGDSIRSAYKRHKEMIRRELKKEVQIPVKKYAGVVRITKEVLEGLLNLQEGIQIQHLEYDHMRGIVDILLLDDTKTLLPEVAEAARPMNISIDGVIKKPLVLLNKKWDNKEED